jgi:hypothetical protein
MERETLGRSCEKKETNIFLPINFRKLAVSGLIKLN